MHKKIAWAPPVSVFWINTVKNFTSENLIETDIFYKMAFFLARSLLSLLYGKVPNEFQSINERRKRPKFMLFSFIIKVYSLCLQFPLKCESFMGWKSPINHNLAGKSSIALVF